jgi:hypothetical protein
MSRRRSNPDPDEEFENLEDLLNFDEEIEQEVKLIYEDRKLTAADKYRSKDIRLDDFPGWNLPIIERMKSTFEVFDVGGDGLVDFEEMNEILDDFGDESGPEERKIHFDQADTEAAGALDFEEFLTMMYDLTMKAGGLGNSTIDISATAVAKAVLSTAIKTHSKDSKDSGSQAELDLTAMGDSLRKIDRNMKRIRSLDVVQQLEAGVF